MRSTIPRALPDNGTAASFGELSHCDTNIPFLTPLSPGVASGTPLGSVIRLWPARAAPRRPVSSISAVALTCPAQAPMPCFGVASETKGERGERYSFWNICVTRSLKYGVSSTGVVVPAVSLFQLGGWAVTVSRGLVACAGRTGPGVACAALLHWIRTCHFCPAG